MKKISRLKTQDLRARSRLDGTRRPVGTRWNLQPAPIAPPCHPLQAAAPAAVAYPYLPPSPPEAPQRNPVQFRPLTTSTWPQTVTGSLRKRGRNLVMRNQGRRGDHQGTTADVHLTTRAALGTLGPGTPGTRTSGGEGAPHIAAEAGTITRETPETRAPPPPHLPRTITPGTLALRKLAAQVQMCFVNYVVAAII